MSSSTTMRYLQNTSVTSARDSGILLILRGVIPALIIFFALYWYFTRGQQSPRSSRSSRFNIGATRDVAPPPEKDNVEEKPDSEIEARITIRKVTAVPEPQQKRRSKRFSESNLLSTWWKNYTSKSASNVIAANSTTNATHESNATKTATLRRRNAKRRLQKSESVGFSGQEPSVLPTNQSVLTKSRKHPRSRSEPNIHHNLPPDFEAAMATIGEAYVTSGDETSRSMSIEETTEEECFAEDDLHHFIPTEAIVESDSEQRAPSPALPHGSDDFEDFEAPDECCGICLLDYEIGEEVALSPNEECVHAYHKECIVGWLRKNDDCPLCRQPYLCAEVACEP